MSARSDRATVDVTVVVCTYNRAALLADALTALMEQADAPPHEVVVVDNNSTDDTAAVLSRFTAAGRIRAVHEPAQGLSHARNRGIAEAKGELLAFTDDDVRVGATWVRSIAAAFARHPDADMVGGKVEAEWQREPPSWLATAGLAPLALVDYGSEAFRIGLTEPRCLVGANVAVRRGALERLDGFSPRLQRIADGVGSTEDHDFQMRLLRGGAVAVYDPRIIVRTIVPRERLSKRYHRAWHRGHGRFYARMRDPDFEGSRTGTLFGVPAHVYRSAATEAIAWAGSLVRGRGSAAFAHELRLRFLTGFAIERVFERP